MLQATENPPGPSPFIGLNRQDMLNAWLKGLRNLISDMRHNNFMPWQVDKKQTPRPLYRGTTRGSQVTQAPVSVGRMSTLNL